MYCSKCGTELPKDAVFCHKCGEKVIGIISDDNKEEIKAEEKNIEEKKAEEQKTEETKTEEKKAEEKKAEENKQGDPMSNSHMFGKLLMIILNAVLAIKFFGKWFSMPILSFLADSDADFSFIDLVRLFFKSGRLFKATNQNFGEVLADVPGAVKFWALILAALFFISIILILLNIVFYITDRATLKFQMTEYGFITATLLSFGITVLVFQKKVDDAVGMSSLGSKILELTSTYKGLWILLVVTVALFYMFMKSSKYAGIVSDNGKEPLKITIPDSVKKKFKIAGIVLCAALLIFAIVKIRDHFAKDSDGMSAAEVREMLESGKNKIDIEKTGNQFGDIYEEWDSTRSFHINKADGAFVLWSLESYDDGDNFYIDGQSFDYDCFEGETGAIASKNCDITFYVLKPPAYIDPYASCPIDDYDDGDFSMGICGISDVSGSTYYDGRDAFERDEMFSYGEYLIVMVCDNVKDVDIKFAYEDDHCVDGYFGRSDFSYNMYYPGEY